MKALDELGLADRASRFPDELSGGERQRVAIARAVVGDRHLLLADEPSGALDSVNGEAVMRLIRAACQRGVAGVVVTHDAQLASWADRVVFLRDGRVVDQTAPPARPSHSSPRPEPMTTAVDTAGFRHRAGGAPARRAMVRWAWRMFRREWRRQALILALLLWRWRPRRWGWRVSNAAVQTRPHFGTANTIISCPAPITIWPPISPPSRAGSALDVVAHQSIAVPGSVSTIDLRAENPTARTAMSRCASTPGAIRPGPTRWRSPVTWPRPSVSTRRRLARGRPDLAGRRFGREPAEPAGPVRAGGPRTANPVANVSILVDASRRGLSRSGCRAGPASHRVARGDSRTAAEAIVLVLATLGLLFVGLLAVAGFTVMAQRRLRALGMLAPSAPPTATCGW